MWFIGLRTCNPCEGLSFAGNALARLHTGGFENKLLGPTGNFPFNFSVETGEQFADGPLEHRLVRQGGAAFDPQLDWAFLRALNRTPNKDERRILKDFYRANLARFRAAPDTAAQLMSVGEAPRAAGANEPEMAAMALVARAILNLHETITRN